MYTLFQTITGGVDWDEVVRPLVEHIGPEVGVHSIHAISINFLGFVAGFLGFCRT